MIARSWFSILALSALASGGCGSDEASGAGGAAGASGAGASGGASGSAGSSGSGGSSGSAGGPSCDVSQVTGLAVAEIDLDAFPPYAVDGCNLLYVSAASGELVLRDLNTGSETTVAPASDAPRRPTLAGDTLAWEAEQNGKRVVVISAAGNATTVSGPFDHAGEPRATHDAVVFTAWLTADPNGDSDVYLHELASGSATLIAGGAKQQRFADVSSTHVAYSDFAEDPNGYYTGDGASLADVALYERATGIATPIPNLGKQAFPMLGGSGRLGFLEWVMVHPIPKLQAYTIKSVPLAEPLATPITVADVESDARVRPMAQGGLFEWVVRWEGVTTLYRAPVDGSSPPTAVPVDAAVLHAPVANATTTVLAIRSAAGAPPQLEAIAR